MASKSFLLSRLSRALKPPSPAPAPSPSFPTICRPRHLLLEASSHLQNIHASHFSYPSRNYCSLPLHLNDDAQGPAAVDYRSLMQEDEFHTLADSTIHGLQEKLEEYGDNVQMDGFDVDYGNEVLTLKLGDLGTYVLNKHQTDKFGCLLQ